MKPHPSKQYLLTIYQPDGPPPPSEVLRKIMRDVDAVNAEMKAAGAWVFSAGLHPPSTATVVRSRPGSADASDALIIDGPFVEGKEHVGGVCIVRAPDLDAALEWARRIAHATTLPIEVRPFQGDGRD